MLVRPLSAVVVAVCLLTITCAAQEPNNTKDEKSPELSIPTLAAKIKQSLVAIRIVGRDGQNASFATGFVISADGLVATAFHSIAEGYGIRIETQDGRELNVTHVHARLEAADLVVLKVDANNLVPLPIGDSLSVVDGQSVVAVGHPQGQRNSVASGLISRRELINNIEMLQLSMPIERGSSGEPVVDRQGNVIAVVTLKSAEQTNVGFAVPTVHLQRMLEDPSPISIKRWETTGRLADEDWSILWDANWRRRGTAIAVDGYGKSFGGRSLCLATVAPPEVPFELQVDVKLTEESGAAGLAFHSDGNHKHYGFYPSAGNIRMTRFGGPSLDSWTILHNEPSSAYKPGEWNTLKVRVEKQRLVFFVNDQQMFATADDRLPLGKVGLVAFRGTEAMFRRFRMAQSIPSSLPDAETRQQISSILQQVNARRPAPANVVEQLLPFEQYSPRLLEQQARELENRARRMRQLADDVHLHSVTLRIKQALGLNNKQPAGTTDAKDAGDDLKADVDLLTVGLLIATLDNPDLEIQPYIDRIGKLASEISRSLPETATDAEKLQAVDKMLFEEYGFHGSRFEYNSAASSYLNQVIDDAEGLPIALAVIYIEVAKRVGLTAHGIGLPGHFVVQLQSSNDHKGTEFIDVFNKGKRLSKADADALIANRGFAPDVEFFKPQTSLQIASRMLVNLLGLAEQKKDDDSVYRYLEVLAQLNPDNAQYRGQRMLMRAQTQRFDEALSDIEWFLQRSGDADELDQLYELRAEFERRIEEQQAQD